MINLTINGKPVNYPTCWEDLAFEQHVSIMENADFTHVVAMLLGMNDEEVRNAEVSGLELILEATKFVYTSDAEFEEYYDHIGPFKLNGHGEGRKFDIRFESMGQFADMRSEMVKHEYTFIMEEKDGKKQPKFFFKDPVKAIKAYARYVAIYLQKIEDGAYIPSKVPEMEARVMKFNSAEVMAVGQFFFLKLTSLLNGTHETFLNTYLSQKSLRPDLTPSLQSSAPTARSRKWRKK